MSEDDELPYRLAILYDKTAKFTPSNPEAIEKFTKAANLWNFKVEIINTADFYRLHEFDALFVRETTALNNDTYCFVKAAENLGIAVIDDSESMKICCNKSKQARLFE